MAKKLIYINDLYVGYGTSAEVSAEPNTESTATFDGPVTYGEDNVPHTVKIERLRYGKIADYKQLAILLHDMLATPYPITIKEDVKMVDGKVRVTDRVYNCLLSNDNYKLDPEAGTVESLEFSGGKRSRWIGGEKIY